MILTLQLPLEVQKVSLKLSKHRGNVYSDFGAQASGGALTDFDAVLKQLDKQGAIEENMLFLGRDLSLEIDDILAPAKWRIFRRYFFWCI
jgi:hypothetical protein